MKNRVLRLCCAAALLASTLGGTLTVGATGIALPDAFAGKRDQTNQMRYQPLGLTEATPSVGARNALPTARHAVPLREGNDNRHPKLESVLAELARAANDGDEGAVTAMSQARDVTLEKNRVRVVIETGEGTIERAAEAVVGMGVTEETRNGNLLQAMAPVDALIGMANLEEVIFVRLPFIGHLPAVEATPAGPAAGGIRARQGAVVSEGVRVIGADAWHAAGFRGQGVRVAVIDQGFAGYQALLGTELPSTVLARSFRADGDITGGGVDHGTACAEIVHDVAPDAELLLLNALTDVETANAIDFAIAQGVDVVSMSVTFFVGPFDGTGFLPGKVTDARNAGILWANSAGNYANEHWRGNFSDPNGDSFLDFAPGVQLNAFSVPPDSSIRVILSWNDFPASAQDYDLFLFRQTDGGATQVAASTNIQNGIQPPFEAITFRTTSGGVFGVGIQRASATRDVLFQLFALGRALAVPVAATSVGIPADAPSAVAVGATLFSNDQLEDFSSHGPTVDGRIKPDLAAPDAVSTVTFSSFFGTSAAAPHVAGAAALVKSAGPSLSPAQIQSFLEQRALDLGPPGKDNLFGAGRLNLGPPNIAPGPPPGGACPPGAPFFLETGFCIDNAAIRDYFEGRGGTNTFGFPASRTFRLLGFPAQVFQRHVLRVHPDGVRPLNLLDPDVLPVTAVNGATFPTHNPALAASAPPPTTPNFGQAVLAHLQATVPDNFEGENVQFLQSYLSAGQQAAQQGAFAPLVALEIWGFPTSAPARDPNNANFIYQRFQRGILHSFTSPSGRVTRGILLADNLKFVITNDPVNLPGDLSAQVQGSPFFNQYCPNNPAWICRPAELPDTDLTSTFEPLQ